MFYYHSYNSKDIKEERKEKEGVAGITVCTAEPRCIYTPIVILLIDEQNAEIFQRYYKIYQLKST